MPELSDFDAAVLRSMAAGATIFHSGFMNGPPGYYRLISEETSWADAAEPASDALDMAVYTLRRLKLIALRPSLLCDAAVFEITAAGQDALSSLSTPPTAQIVRELQRRAAGGSPTPGNVSLNSAGDTLRPLSTTSNGDTRFQAEEMNAQVPTPDTMTAGRLSQLKNLSSMPENVGEEGSRADGTSELPARSTPARPAFRSGP